MNRRLSRVVRSLAPWRGAATAAVETTAVQFPSLHAAVRRMHTGLPTRVLRCAAVPPPPAPATTTPAAAGADRSAVSRAREAETALASFRRSMEHLLDDRRVLYRDQQLLDAILPHRELLKTALTAGWAGSITTPLTASSISELREVWSRVMSPQEFYSLLISSAIVQCDADIRLLLHDMSEAGVSTTPAVFEAILSSLPAICVDHGTSREADSTAAATATVKEEGTATVLGQAKVLSRSTMGDLAGYYMGLALKQHPSPQPEGAAEMNRLWGRLFTVAALAQAAPKLMDLWWQKLMQYGTTADPSGGALPLTAVHAAVSWSASSKDIERSMRYFHEANKRGLALSSADAREQHTVTFFAEPGALTRRSESHETQCIQLRLLAKLMETAKSVKRDGGLRELVVKDLQRLIDPEVLQRDASWEVLNDVLGGLSMPSAMQLVKLCANARNGGDADVPFAIWASLLRRCAHEHHQDEANALFHFLRKRFSLTGQEKRELVEIMLRMHTAMGDFASAMDTFLTHVLHKPDNEPAVHADATLYNLLIRAADSRNAAMMVFLEACSVGVGMDATTFENLLAANSLHSVARLSRRLPHDYTSSRLDAQVRIPANADAHVRREEALKMRGKPNFDSTGESG